jgi:endonuclease-3
MTRKQRAEILLQQLPLIYPDAHCELDFKNPLELLVATILSAQCTDVRVNLVTKELFKRCKTAADYADISQEELEGIVHSTGFYRNKAKSLRGMGATLVERHAGEIPSTMEELSAIPGAGRKTANVVLGNAYDINEGVVVDTHVGRLSRRLGMTTKSDPIKVEQDLMALVPRDQWTHFSHWLIWHGRRRCKARNPECKECELRDLCPSVDHPDRFLKKGP